MRPRRSIRLALTAGLTLALAGSVTLAPITSASAHPGGRHPGGQHPGDRHGAGPAHIDLPAGFAPEGIAIAGDHAYLGSRTDGDLYRVDLRTGRGAVFSQGPGTASLGLKISHGLIYVSGGGSGTGRIVEARTGTVKRSITFTTNASFVNDVVLTRHTAWFTDSLQPQLYGVALDRHGSHHPRGSHQASTPSFRTLKLSGDWTQVPKVNNANGITQTPDGKALLVVQSATGLLFRVDPRTGVARKVDLGGQTLTAGDGLLLRGRTLYAVQNRENRIAVIKLDRSGRRGTVQRHLTSPDFDVPTTVAARGRSLYLPNARFSTPQTPTTSYWITRVRP